MAGGMEEDQNIIPERDPLLGKPFFARVSNDYLLYLSKIDCHVPQKQRRPYIVGIINIDNITYALPFTSQIITQNGNLRSESLTDFITDEHGNVITALQYNYMIPVSVGCYTKINVASAEKVDMIRDEARYLRKHRDAIAKKAASTRAIQMSGKNPFYNSHCCDYRALEDACHLYRKEHLHIDDTLDRKPPGRGR